MPAIEDRARQTLRSAIAFLGRSNANWWGVLIAAGTASALLMTVVHQTYNSNDGPAIRLLLEGRFVPAGIPTAQVFFMNLGFTQGLLWLYSHIPGLPWFDLAEQAVLGASCLLALRLLQLSGATLAEFVFAAIILFAAVAQPQFSAIALLAAGVSGLALTLTCSQRFSSVPRLERIIIITVSTVLLAAGLCLRLLAGVLGVGLVGVFLIIGGKRRVSSLRASTILPAAAAFAVAALLWVLHFQFYTGSQPWRDFDTLNLARAAVTEYAETQDISIEQSPTALSADDRAALATFAYFDESAFPAKKIVAAGRSSWRDRFGGFELFPFVRQVVRAGAMLLPIEIAVIFLSYGAPRRYFVALWASATACAAVVCLLLLFLKAPPWRVLWPMGLVQSLTLIACRPRDWIPNRIGTAGVLIAVTVTLTIIVWVSHTELVRARAVKADLDLIAASHPSVIVSLGNAVPLDALERPFRTGPVQRSYRIVVSGVLIRSPVVMAQLRHWSRSSLADRICQDHSTYVAGDPPAIDALRRYYSNHKSLNVRFQPSFIGRVVNVYTCEVLGVISKEG